MHTSDIIQGITDRKNELGMSNQQLSDASGVPKSTVDRILSGRTDNPSLQNVLDLANAVGYEFEGARPAMPPAPVTPGDSTAQLRAIYEDRIKSYERLLARDQRHHNMLMAEKNRWIMFSMILNIVLVGFLVGVLIYDIANRDIGWVRDQIARWEQSGIFQQILGLFRGGMA